MAHQRASSLIFAVVCAVVFARGMTVARGAEPAAVANPLPSWNDTASREAIVLFVARTTTPSSPEFIPPAERVAVFDNDGTLWAEKPMYVQFRFAMDRVRAMAADHPEWRERQPFKGILENDMKAIMEAGEHGLIEALMATHAGMTTDEFDVIVGDWLATARHPTTGRLFTGMVYQPMLEVLAYLRENGFRTFIASGGGVEFMRVFAEKTYGVPPDQVIGSSIKTAFQIRDELPVLMRLPEVDFIGDKGGKPVGIHARIGRRPVAAFGNSDGDLQMLQWTTLGAPTALGMIVRHDDAEREWAYDRDSQVGRLDEALDLAAESGWILISMKNDWRQIFPPTEP
jgi:hypothetical protein